MKRLLNFAAGLLGVLALGVLVVALVFTFSGRQNSTRQVSQVFQSPIGTPRSPSVKPTPITPPPTIFPKPSRSPSPLPQTPTSSETPTIVPTPRTTVTQSAPGTPTSVPTFTGPLPAGAKLIYGETDGPFGTTVIWLASTKNPELRRALTTLTHKVGYGVQGAVSPDGSKVAYLVIPSGISERTARTGGGELWVMNSDGAAPHRVADQVAWVHPLTLWAPDSRSLMFGRRVPLENPAGAQVALRTEFYVVSVNGPPPRLLLVDDTSHDIQPVGWVPDGQLFYYAKWQTLQDRWELWRVDMLSDAPQYQTSAPSPNAESPLLMPDGMHIIYSLTDGGQRVLVMSSIDGREQKTIIGGARGEQPINRYVAIWSVDGQNILVHVPPEGEQPFRLEQINLKTGQRRTVITGSAGSTEFLIPRSWSPDGAWLVVLKYPRIQSIAYLLDATRGGMAQIPLTQPSNWITWLGWTDR